MTFQSNLPAVVERLRRARMAGLVAAADVYVEAMKRALRGGFTTGKFSDNTLADSVTRSEPDADGQGIYVGTRWVYALMWELGHLNAFTRQFERQERWVPTFQEQRGNIRAAYARAFRAAMAGV